MASISKQKMLGWLRLVEKESIESRNAALRGMQLSALKIESDLQNHNHGLLQ